MDSSNPAMLPSSFVLVAGLIQFVFFVWVFIFPMLILKKLNEILEALQQKL
ncbi:hypothetical protein ACFL38_04175 [Candidatus Omnitrophota bacterium]